MCSADHYVEDKSSPCHAIKKIQWKDGVYGSKNGYIGAMRICSLNWNACKSKGSSEPNVVLRFTIIPGMVLLDSYELGMKKAQELLEDWINKFIE